MNISRQQLHELREVIEDTVEYFCDQQMSAGEPVSGELAYTVVETIATAKLAELQSKNTVNDLITKIIEIQSKI